MDILTESMDMLVQILILILGLAIVWFVLRLFLRLTMRIFTLGCGLIIVLGLCVLVFQLFR
jgi:hypothetical protein